MTNKKLVIDDLGAGWVDLGLTVADRIDAQEITRPCVGCFGCWTKTPGNCLIQDGFETIGPRFAACDELVLISACVYGGFSPAVKNVLDRCIGYMMPHFRLRADGQMHHLERYPKQLRLSAYFYGERHTAAEEETARKLVVRNALNLNAVDSQVYFCREAAEIGGCWA